MKQLLIAFTFFLLGTYSLQGQNTILHCGHIIDVNTNQVLPEKSVVIQGDRIINISDGYITPTADDKVIDLKDKYVMPGLMDMHVHIESELHPKSYEYRFRLNDADVALEASKFCERSLMAGFTTVRDLGGSGVNVSLRNAINKGHIVGPHLITAEKSIATTGGHADPTNGVKDDLMGDPGPKDGVINSVEEAYKAVRQRYKNGADCIKITSTGGVLSVAKDGSGPQFTIEEIKAIVTAADDYGFVVAAHAHGNEGIKRAILGGVHSIEHGTMMNDENRALMIEHGTYIVPTLSAGLFVVEKTKTPGFFPPVIVPKAIEVGEEMMKNFSKTYQAGVKIAFGTDTGVSPHGDNAKEFIYMVEGGMPPLETIQTATKNAAELMRMYDEVGSLEKGKRADIVAVNENPANNIATMTNVSFVMKSGMVYKSE